MLSLIKKWPNRYGFQKYTHTFHKTLYTLYAALNMSVLAYSIKEDYGSASRLSQYFQSLYEVSI